LCMLLAQLEPTRLQRTPPMQTNHDLNPLLLIIDHQETSVRSLESVLRPKGHVILKASTGHQALDLTTKVSPDAILVAQSLPDFDGVDLIRRLTREATVRATTPILLTAGTTLGKAERLEALGAGAWDILDQPLDATELILKLDTFVRAKQEIDRVRDQGLTDPATGFYNVRGVLKRAKELNADSARAGRPLACVALGWPSQDEADTLGGDEGQFTERVSAALQAVTRTSDTLGFLSDGEFVVVAPGTNSDGAVRLADRILEELAAEGRDSEALADLTASVRAGFYSVSSPGETSPEDMLLGATMALRRAQQDDGSFRVRAYDA